MPCWPILNWPGTQKNISKNELIEESGAGDASIKSLIEKEIFIAEERNVSRLYFDEDEFSDRFSTK